MSTLHEQYLELELLTDVCVSSSNRTLEASAPQGCLPGRLVWGVLATRAYQQGGMSPDDIFRIFHQGSVRFRDALPLEGDAIAYPIPQACQRPKSPAGGKVTQNMALPSVRKASAGVQHKTIKDGWATAAGAMVEVEKRSSLRTSVDPSGRALAGHLYGVQALEGGQRFASALVGPKEDVERVLGLLKDPTLRIGRSRNAELGLVKVHVKGAKARLSDLCSTPKSAEGQISFLCVSRCALRDPRSGAATSVPSPEAFGLDGGWRFEPASSFMTTTRVVHFNGHRKRPEPERLVLERGSVVTFCGAADSIDIASLRETLRGGVGDFTGEGYGEVAVAPDWLVTDSSTFTPATENIAPSAKRAEPADELFAWAKSREQQRQASSETFKKAHALIDELRLRRIARAQWGAIHRMAREARFDASKRSALPDQLKSLLHGGKEAKEAIKDSYGKIIDWRTMPTGGARNLDPIWRAVRVKFLEECGKVPLTDLPYFLEHLAGACMRPEPKTAHVGGERR